MTSVDEESEMNAEERSRTKRSIGSVRDDMGAIVGEMLCGSVAICYAIRSTGLIVTFRGVPLSTAHVASANSVVGNRIE